MTDGDTIAFDELRRMARLPVGRDLLTRLVYRTSGGVFASFDGAVLRAIDGASVEAEKVGVAHAIDLQAAGAHETWQQAFSRPASSSRSGSCRVKCTA